MLDRSNDVQPSLVKVHPDREIETSQRLPYFVGISALTAGAKGLSMYLVVVPPGGHAEPHVHGEYETAIYVLEGRVETRYGAGLRESVVTEACGFLFIPPGVSHQPLKLSETTPAKAIVARNQPDEHEQVLPYDPASES